MTAPKLVKSISEWRKLRGGAEFSGKTSGVVPTMGALHRGHEEMLQQASKENDLVVMTLFVNPTQFNDPRDLAKYPRNLKQDLEIAGKYGVHYVFAPDPSEMYADDYRYEIREKKLSRIMEGEHRHGHFDGVLTVVMKLLLLAKADRAYFGEKDFQQLDLVRGMAEAFFLETQIVAVPTVRDSDGLALSSRNVLLSPEQRKMAALFPKSLKSKSSLPEIREQLRKAGFVVDYIEENNGRRFGAVRLGDVRLIDNFKL